MNKVAYLTGYVQSIKRAQSAFRNRPRAALKRRVANAGKPVVRPTINAGTIQPGPQRHSTPGGGSYQIGTAGTGGVNFGKPRNMRSM